MDSVATPGKGNNYGHPYMYLGLGGEENQAHQPQQLQLPPHHHHPDPPVANGHFGQPIPQIQYQMSTTSPLPTSSDDEVPEKVALPPMGTCSVGAKKGHINKEAVCRAPKPEAPTMATKSKNDKLKGKKKDKAAEKKNRRQMWRQNARHS